MGGEVIGRDGELAALSDFLLQPGSQPDVFVLEGGPGIGKSTLWRTALRTASERGYRVLASEPLEAESRLAFAGLGDLLQDAPADALPQVGAMQRRALEVALLLREPGAEPPDERAIAFGLAAVLRLLARRQPLLLAVDDLHWLDDASARALLFAVRRLEEESAKLLCTRRSDTEIGTDPLERALAEGRLRRLTVGPLAPGALQRIVRRRLGLQLPRPLLARVHRAAAGSPFYALQLARALAEAGDLEPGAPLPIPGSLDDVTRARLARLGEPARDVLAAVALLARPTVAGVHAVMSRRRRVEHVLRDSAEAGILELADERIRFTHPLLAEAALAAALPRRRRELHRRAAAVSSSPEERARHLALAAEGPDEGVAAALEQAARQARARGARGSAAELAELAVKLTRAGAAGNARRRLLAAEYHGENGDLSRMRRMLDELIGTLSPGRDRAAALHLLSLYLDDVAAGTELCAQALSEADGDAGVRYAIHRRLGRFLGLGGDLEGWRRELELAMELAEETGDDGAYVGTASELSFVRFLAGAGVQRDLVERAQARADALESFKLTNQPRLWLGVQLSHADDVDGARSLMEAFLEETRRRGGFENVAIILVLLADLELRAGNCRSAERYATRATELADEVELSGDVPVAVLLARAAVDAHLGRVESARDAANRGSRLAEAMHELIWQTRHECVLGSLALSLDDPAAAWEHLAPLPERLRRMGVGEPSFFPVLPNAAEALIGLGRIEEAEGLVDELERQGRNLRRGSALAVASRCRGLLAAGAGELDLALELGSDAVSRHEQLPYPLELGRSLLALGATQRRAKKRSAARESLQRALATFEYIGAVLWQQKAAAELRRIAGRRSAGQMLTPSEEQAAQLVAQGLSNKEIAAALFVSVHTVEASLSRVYRKLGVRSRAQLAHRLSSQAKAKV